MLVRRKNIAARKVRPLNQMNQIWKQISTLISEADKQQKRQNPC